MTGLVSARDRSDQRLDRDVPIEDVGPEVCLPHTLWLGLVDLIGPLT